MSQNRSDLRECLEEVRRGLTLPARWYTDPVVYEREVHDVFGSTWQLVCLTSDLPDDGGVHVVSIEKNQSFVLTKDPSGRIRGFWNICPHRAATLCLQSGATRTIQCGYHGWTFKLDGSLHRAPLMDGDPGFRPSEFALNEVRVETVEPFVFLNPSATAEPLSEYLGDLPSQLAALGVDTGAIARRSYSRVMDRIYACNWKVAVENGMECYHCSIVHPGFANTVDLSRWQIKMGGNVVTQGARIRRNLAEANVSMKPGRLGQMNTTLALSEGGNDLILFHFVFPNQTIQVWPGSANSFSIGRFIPAGPHHVRRLYTRYWSTDVPEDVSEESWAFTMQVAGEDQKICEGVQVSLQSGGFSRGKFQLVSTSTGEHGAQRMNELLTERLLRVGGDPSL